MKTMKSFSENQKLTPIQRPSRPYYSVLFYFSPSTWRRIKTAGDMITQRLPYPRLPRPAAFVWWLSIWLADRPARQCNTRTHFTLEDGNMYIKCVEDVVLESGLSWSNCARPMKSLVETDSQKFQFVIQGNGRSRFLPFSFYCDY